MNKDQIKELKNIDISKGFTIDKHLNEKIFDKVSLYDNKKALKIRIKKSAATMVMGSKGVNIVNKQRLNNLKKLENLLKSIPIDKDHNEKIFDDTSIKLKRALEKRLKKSGENNNDDEIYIDS